MDHQVDTVIERYASRSQQVSGANSSHRYDMIWYDMIMIWYDMKWYDMIWYDMIWYDMIW